MKLHQQIVGKKMLEEHRIDVNFTDSIVFFEEGGFSLSSTAALRVFSYFDGWERHLHLLIILPRPLRDAFYKIIAKHRYKWFGRSEHCMIPTPELRERFLTE